MIESVAAEKNHRREERQTVQLPVENGSRVCIVHFIVVTVCERGSSADRALIERSVAATLVDGDR